MIEFSAQTGGRHTYVDDILNLQDLSLAINKMFDGCDNFVISGCEVNGVRISSGFVYINGKIRYFPGTNAVASFPVYLAEYNYTESVAYADSADKVGRTVYSVQALTLPPNTTDAVTGNVPEYILIRSDNTKDTINDAFFGKYALILNTDSEQEVAGAVSFKSIVSLVEAVNSGAYKIRSGYSQCNIEYSQDGTLVIRSVVDSDYSIQLTKEGDLLFKAGTQTIAGINAAGRITASSVIATTVKGGNIAITNSAIYNDGVNADDGSLDLNCVGFDGGYTKFRDLRIGDGKGTTVVFIDGSEHEMQIAAQITATSSYSGITLQHTTMGKSNPALVKVIDWKDKDGENMASVGYSDVSTSDFIIKNIIGSIKLDSDVNISGNLVVQGTPLSAYALLAPVTAALNTKANADNVYSKTAADDRYVAFSSGLAELVRRTSASQVRGDIGAMSRDDVAALCPTMANAFSDIATFGLSPTAVGYTEQLVNRKRAICSNIGAAYIGDMQEKILDTGWIHINTGKNFDIDDMWVRQFGNMVFVQGTFRTMRNGVCFTLPNTISPPVHPCQYSCNWDGEFHYRIEAGSREVKCVRYQGAGYKQTVNLSFSYMV